MKPSANGRSSSLTIQGLHSSMHALGHNSGVAGTKTKITEALLRLALATRGAVLVNAERETGNFATCWRSAERISFSRLGSSPLRGCVATGGVRDKQAWHPVSGVLVQAVLSREERRSEVQSLLHEVQGCRPTATYATTNRRPLPSRCCSGPRWNGKMNHSVEMPSEERQGCWLDGKQCNATTCRRDSTKISKWQSPQA